jgi:hypothetical protein
MKHHIGIIIGISILMNAFLAGFVLSDQITRHRNSRHGDFEHHRPPEFMFLSMLEEKSHTLSQDGEKTVLAILEKNKANLQMDKMEKVHELFDKLQDVLLAEQLDQKKLKALHNELIKTEFGFKEALGNMMTEIAISISKEDRVKFFKDLGPRGHPMPPHDMPPPDDMDN